MPHLAEKGIAYIANPQRVLLNVQEREACQQGLGFWLVPRQ